MAAEFVDGINGYNSDALMIDNGWTASSWGSIYPETSNGRYSGRGRVGIRYQAGIQHRVPAELATKVLGFSYYTQSDSEPTDGEILATFGEYGGNQHCSVRMRTGRVLQVYSLGTARGSASAYVLPQDQWVNIQIKANIHDSTGSVVIQCDNVTVLTTSGIDTKNGGDGFITEVGVEGINPTGYYSYVDDIAVWSTTGDAPTDFVTDFDIEPLYVLADSTAQFSRSGGSTNYENVDEAVSNEGTDYVYDSVTGQYDRYSLGDMSGTIDTIYAVQTKGHIAKSDAGGVLGKIGVYSGTTEDLSAAIYPGTDYAYFTHLMTVNPDDSAAWAESDVNALLLQCEVG